MPALLVFTTAPDIKTARKIARSLVTQNLAACVSLSDKTESFYLWKDRLERKREVVVLIKTMKEKYKRLETFLKKLHPYELPEILAVPVSKGEKRYLSWVRKSLI